jgi:hypothetical protein
VATIWLPAFLGQDNRYPNSSSLYAALRAATQRPGRSPSHKNQQRWPAIRLARPGVARRAETDHGVAPHSGTKTEARRNRRTGSVMCPASPFALPGYGGQVASMETQTPLHSTLRSESPPNAPGVARPTKTNNGGLPFDSSRRSAAQRHEDGSSEKSKDWKRDVPGFPLRPPGLRRTGRLNGDSDSSSLYAGLQAITQRPGRSPSHKNQQRWPAIRSSEK